MLAARGGLFVDAGTPLLAKARQLAKLWAGHTVYSDGRHFNAVACEIIAMQVLQAFGVLTLAEFS